MTDNRLKALVARAVTLRAERRAALADYGDMLREVYAEAKAVGYDSAVFRRLVERAEMHPAERAEADEMLALYEAAIDMPEAEAEQALVALRPDAAAIALELLTAEVVGLEDPQHAAALVEHMLALLDLRAEIALLRKQESDRKKLAKAEGFDARQMALAVRWFEKCAKHGSDAMKAGEATFDLYRATFGARSPTAALLEGSAEISSDTKLQALFAPAKPDASARRRSTARELAAMARRASEGGPA